MQVRLSEVRGFPSIRLSGRFSEEDVVTWLLAVGEHEAAPAAVLCDLTQVDFSVPSGEVIKAAQSYADRGVMPGRLAFVVADGLGFGLVRMFISFLGSAAAEQASVFRTQDEAVDWLEKFGDPARRPRPDRRPRGSVRPAA